MPACRIFAFGFERCLQGGVVLDARDCRPCRNTSGRPDCIRMRMRPASLASRPIIFLPVLASTALPISMKRSQVMFCMSSGLKPACLEIVLAVIHAGDAGIEGHAIDLAVNGHQLHLVGSKAGIIDLARHVGKSAGERLQVFLRAVIFDQHDIRKRIRGARRRAPSAASARHRPWRNQRH